MCALCPQHRGKVNMLDILTRSPRNPPCPLPFSANFHYFCLAVPARRVPAAGKSSELKTMKKTLILLALALAALAPATGQTVKQLENERKATLQKMEATSKLLDQTKQSQQSSLNKLNLLSTRIRERQSLISTINREVNQLDNEIKSLTERQARLQERLAAVKADYARLVQQAYVHRGAEHKLMFVLSAESFDQSLRRLRYLRQYAAYRREQAREIERITAEIDEQNRAAEAHRLTRLEALQQKEAEAKRLATDRREENRLLADLKKKEKNLRTQLAAQQKKAARLDGQIEKLIAEEIRKEEARKAAAKAKEKPASGTQPAPAPAKEERLTGGNFEANRGRLPWPVASGVVTGKFGIHPHPVLKAVTTNNKGIYIQTTAGSDARAVYDGVVTQCFAIPGNNNAVIVKHGVYRTVYANLTALYVKEGDKLAAKQRIGKVYTDDLHGNKTELYFQLWKEKTLLNPEPWLAK